MLQACPDRVKPGLLRRQSSIRVGHGRTVSDTYRGRVARIGTCRACFPVPYVPDMDTDWVWPCPCFIAGHIDLKMTFEKILTLQDVLHVPTLRRNLISESSFLRASYKIVEESNKLVISKSNIFIRKGFVCDGLFCLNVINSSDNEIFIPVTLNIESCDLTWKIGTCQLQFHQEND